MALVDGTIHPLEQDLLDSVQKYILKTDFDVEALEPISPEELAAAVPAGEFHLGVQITPATVGAHGFVKPHLILKAFERGAQVNRDLISDWNPQDDFERDVDELRKELGILPR